MSEDTTIAVCPECDHYAIRYRSTSDDWRCQGCRSVVSEPAYRPAKSHTDGGFRSPHGQALLDMDPDDLRADGGRWTHVYDVDEDRAGISYGPWSEDGDVWALSLATVDGERVRLHLLEHAMYELWTEVQHVPWPREPDPKGTLVREIVEHVRGMDAEGLRAVLGEIHRIEGRPD